MTKEQAEEMIAQVAEYLRQQNAAWDRPEHVYDEPEHWNAAARWAHTLLDAANRDGWCGCKLCRG